MIARLSELRRDLGAIGLLALLALAACAGFQLAFVQPLEHESARLDQRLASRPKGRSHDGALTSMPATRSADFYAFLDSGERIDQSLARLYGIAAASGLELRTADYRLGEPRQRLEHYEISLPVQGSYAQIRLFLETSLRELPGLSLDKATLRRKSANESRIDADLVLTLHRIRS